MKRQKVGCLPLNGWLCRRYCTVSICVWYLGCDWCKDSHLFWGVLWLGKPVDTDHPSHKSRYWNILIGQSTWAVSSVCVWWGWGSSACKRYLCNCRMKIMIFQQLDRQLCEYNTDLKYSIMYTYCITNYNTHQRCTTPTDILQRPTCIKGCM